MFRVMLIQLAIAILSSLAILFEVTSFGKWFPVAWGIIGTISLIAYLQGKYSDYITFTNGELTIYNMVGSRTFRISEFNTMLEKPGSVSFINEAGMKKINIGQLDDEAKTLLLSEIERTLNHS